MVEFQLIPNFAAMYYHFLNCLIFKFLNYEKDILYANVVLFACQSNNKSYLHNMRFEKIRRKEVDRKGPNMMLVFRVLWILPIP